jgi:hypothetical protein
VACNQIASLAQDAEQAIEKGPDEVLVLLVSQIQVQAQDSATSKQRKRAFNSVASQSETEDGRHRATPRRE